MNFPNEIFLKIFNILDYTYFPTLAKASHCFDSLLKDELLWKNQCKKYGIKNVDKNGSYVEAIKQTLTDEWIYDSKKLQVKRITYPQKYIHRNPVTRINPKIKFKILSSSVMILLGLTKHTDYKWYCEYVDSFSLFIYQERVNNIDSVPIDIKIGDKMELLVDLDENTLKLYHNEDLLQFKTLEDKANTMPFILLTTGEIELL